MGLLDSASAALTSVFWVVYWFAFFSTILFTAMQFVTGVDFFPYQAFQTSSTAPQSTAALASATMGAFNKQYIDSFVNTLRSAADNQVDVIKAILTMLPALLPIYVKILVMTLTIVAMLVGLFTSMILTFMLLPPDVVIFITAVVEWGTVLFVALAVIMDIAKLIYSLLPFGGGSA